MRISVCKMEVDYFNFSLTKNIVIIIHLYVECRIILESSGVLYSNVQANLMLYIGTCKVERGCNSGFLNRDKPNLRREFLRLV